MPVLVLCGATAYLMERPQLAQRQVPRAWRLVALVTLSAAAFAVVPNTDDDGNFKLGVVDFQPRFWGIFGVSVLGVLLFWVLWKLAARRRDWAKVFLAGVLAFSFLYGTVHLSLTKYPQWGTDSNLIAETYDSVAEIDEILPGDAFYRLDAYGAHNNLGLWFDKSLPAVLQFHGGAQHHGILPRGGRHPGRELQTGGPELRPAGAAQRAVHAGGQGQDRRLGR